MLAAADACCCALWVLPTAKTAKGKSRQEGGHRKEASIFKTLDWGRSCSPLLQDLRIPPLQAGGDQPGSRDPRPAPDGNLVDPLRPGAPPHSEGGHRKPHKELTRWGPAPAPPGRFSLLLPFFASPPSFFRGFGLRAPLSPGPPISTVEAPSTLLSLPLPKEQGQGQGQEGETRNVQAGAPIRRARDKRRQDLPTKSGFTGKTVPREDNTEVVSITYEEIGLFPRSFSRVLDRFLKQIFSDVENLVIQEYRFYRYLFLTTLKCLLILIFIPVFVNFLAKTYIVRPLTEYVWNTKQTEIFLNLYQQKRAFTELKDFEEKIYFESLIYPKSSFLLMPLPLPRTPFEDPNCSKATFGTAHKFVEGTGEPQDTSFFGFEAPDSKKITGHYRLWGPPRWSGAAVEPLPPKAKAPGWPRSEVSGACFEFGAPSMASLPPHRGGGDSMAAPSMVRGGHQAPGLFTPPSMAGGGHRAPALWFLPTAKTLAGGVQGGDHRAPASQSSFRPPFPGGEGSGLPKGQATPLPPAEKVNPEREDYPGPEGAWVIRANSKQGQTPEDKGAALRARRANSKQASIGDFTNLLPAGDYKETAYYINTYTLKSTLFVYQTIEADKNIQQRYQEKTIELAQRYNDQSIEAITNLFADLISLCSFFYLLYALEIQINITKSFLLEVFFGLDDSKKSLLILLVTDLLVGYHSSNLWELFFEFVFHHYGLPESQTGIFLLVATLPVLLDVLFKYLIFRHLNRSSPATVATYHAMIE
uniref:Potassium/proton antiporter CemA n=1 Tax=Stephanosphaera pluvialis TaxID=51712 RepID=A0A0S2IEH4_9CHLO|nr:chloroplast enveloppe membrane protein [Stephanosphaera pluvialis]